MRMKNVKHDFDITFKGKPLSFDDDLAHVEYGAIRVYHDGSCMRSVNIQFWVKGSIRAHATLSQKQFLELVGSSLAS